MVVARFDWDAAKNFVFAADGAGRLLEANGHRFHALAHATALASGG
jgi:hypothetical protein